MVAITHIKGIFKFSKFFGLLKRIEKVRLVFFNMETPSVETFIGENSQENILKYYKSNLLWSCIC